MKSHVTITCVVLAVSALSACSGAAEPTGFATEPAAGMLSSKDNPSMGAPTSFVFQQEGQFWVVQDKAKVCGTNQVTTTPPADAEIPAALLLSGCAAG